MVISVRSVENLLKEAINEMESDTGDVSISNNLLLTALVISSENINRRITHLINVMERVERNQTS